MDILQELERYWGKFTTISNWIEQLDIPFVSEKAKFNILFQPLPISDVNMMFQSKIQISVPDQLKDFYLQFNGCRLFSDSLCIYGLQMHPEDLFEPYDVFQETQKFYIKVKRFKHDYFLIGSLGGQYLFAMDKTNPSSVFTFNSDNGRLEKTYKDFNECFSTIFNNLLIEYDSCGRKIHKNDKYSDIPVLANLCFDIRMLN